MTTTTKSSARIAQTEPATATVETPIFMYESTALCGGCILVLGMITVIIMFYVYAILGLIQTSHDDIRDVCHASNIWVYVLVGLILSALSVGSGSSSSNREAGDEYRLPPSLIIVVSQFTAFIIWGAFEIFSPCVRDHFQHTLLYNVALSYWIFCIIGISVVLTIICGTVVWVWASIEGPPIPEASKRPASVPPLNLPV